MVMMGDSTLPTPLELEPHYKRLFSVISRIAIFLEGVV